MNQVAELRNSTGGGTFPDEASFREIFENIKDPRIARTRLHPLSAVLFLCLRAVICGADSIVGIERYGLAKIGMLERFMPFANGMPSHDTICEKSRQVESARAPAAIFRMDKGRRAVLKW